MDELIVVTKKTDDNGFYDDFQSEEAINADDYFNPTVFNCKLTNTLSGHESDVLCLTVTHEKIITGSNDNTIKIWDLNTGKLLNTLYGHNSGVYSVTVANGKILSTSSDRTIKIWDLNSGILETTILGHTNHVYSIAATDSIFVTASLDKTVKIWDLETKKLLNVIKDNVSSWSVALYEGKIIAGQSDGTMKIWELDTGKFITSYRDHEDSITSISVKNGKIVSGSKDKTIKVWDMGLEPLVTINSNNSPVWAVLNTDGKIVSGSEDKVVRIWNLFDGKLIDTLWGHTDWISGLTSAFGRIISCSADSSIMIWSKIPMHNCNTIDITVEKTEKTSFETDIELEKRTGLMKNKFFTRLISYDFIDIGKAELMAEDYSRENKILPLTCSVTCEKILSRVNFSRMFSSDISIDIASAENLYNRGRFHDLYIKFFFDDEKLKYSLYIVFGYRKYRLNPQIKLIEHEVTKKFSVKSDRLKIIMGESSLNYQICNDIPRHNCNSIDITDTFRSPFEPVDKFEKRVKAKLIDYSYINIGKIELDGDNYSIGNQVFPLTAFITCDKIINLSDLKRTFKGKINIDRYRAKNMFDRSKAHNLYIRFYEKDNQLCYELSIIYEGLKYFISAV